MDFATDTYDAGLHMNLSGATKLTSYFGEILLKQCSVNNRSDDVKLQDIWAEKKQAYIEEIERQKEKYGIQ